MDEIRLECAEFDGTSKHVNEIIRVVLDEHEQSLTEEDRKILQDRDQLRNNFHTLQNVSPLATSWSIPDHIELPVSSKSDVYFVDIDAIEQPSLTLENVEPTDVEVDNTIAAFIQDENIKAEVLGLNEQIEVNAMSIRSLSNEARNILMEKLNLKRRLFDIEKKVSSFSSTDARVKRIKRKKGSDCASTGHQKKTYFCRFGAPYFKTKERFPADRNDDLIEIIRQNQFMMLRLPRIKRFLPHDATSLEKNVLKQLKAKRVEQLEKCLMQATRRQKTERDNQNLADEIRCIERAIKETEGITHISATKDWNIPVDFMTLSQLSRFSAEENERIWCLIGCPTFSRTEFSQQELAELKLLVEKYKRQNWDQIASEMSTRRSGFMCFTKYVVTEKKGKNMPWTKEENALLHNLCISMDFVTKCDNRYQYWKSIRRYFPHRTYQQIHAHWTYVLEPRLKKGRFTSDECRVMQKLLREGKSYREIAQLVQNRTCVQIRTHFEAMASKKIVNCGNWTPEEEQELLRLIEKYGSHNWVQISKELGTRNRSQCRLKYSVFLRNNCRFTIGSRTLKEFWTDEENEKYKELLLKYGTDFRKIKEEMPTKTVDQLRHKFHRAKRTEEFHDLISTLKVEPKKFKCTWTNDDIELFKKLLLKYGPRFKIISPMIPGKSPLQLRYKYYCIRKNWNVPLPVWRPITGCKVGNIERKLINKDEKRTTSAPFAHLPLTVTYSDKLPTVEERGLLPAELFENVVPVSNINHTLPSGLAETLLNSSKNPLVSSTNLFSGTSVLNETATNLCNENYRLTTPNSNSVKYHLRIAWTVEEEELFKQLLMQFGLQYKKISSFMPGRSPRMLRQKYFRWKDKWKLKLPSIADINVDHKKLEIERDKTKKASSSASEKQFIGDNKFVINGNISNQNLKIPEKLKKVASEILAKPSEDYSKLSIMPDISPNIGDKNLNIKPRKMKKTVSTGVNKPLTDCSDLVTMQIAGVQINNENSNIEPKKRKKKVASTVAVKPLTDYNELSIAQDTLVNIGDKDLKIKSGKRKEVAVIMESSTDHNDIDIMQGISINDKNLIALPKKREKVTSAAVTKPLKSHNKLDIMQSVITGIGDRNLNPKSRKMKKVASTVAPKLSVNHIKVGTMQEIQQFPIQQRLTPSNILEHIIQEVATGPHPPVQPVPIEDTCEKSIIMASKSRTRSSKSIWTEDEVEQFKQLLIVHGPQYKKISKLMPGKSDSQIRYKHKCILKEVECISSNEPKDNVAEMKNKKYKKATPAILSPDPDIEVFKNIVAASSKQQKSPLPLFITTKNHSFLVSNSGNFSAYTGLVEDGFAGFPDESGQSSSSFRELIPLQSIEHVERPGSSSSSFQELIPLQSIEHMERPGSSYEHMIVPERISEILQQINNISEVSKNRYSLCADKNESVTKIVSDTDGDLEIKYETEDFKVEEEDRMEEFSV